MADHLFNSKFQVKRTPTFLSGPIRSYHAAEDTSDTGAGGRSHPHPRPQRVQDAHGQTRYADDVPYRPPRDRDDEISQYIEQQSSRFVPEYTGRSPQNFSSPGPIPGNPHHASSGQSQRPINPAVIPTGYPPSAFHGHQPIDAFAQGPPITFGPDPGPFIRRHLSLPPNVPVTLATLPEYPPGAPPGITLPVLAQVAIYGSARKRLTLQEICLAIEGRYEYYRNEPTGAWRRSIRHALSLHKVFRNLERAVQEPGKGGYWTLDYSKGEGTKRPRIRRSTPAPAAVEEGDESSEVDSGDTSTDLDSESGSEHEEHSQAHYGHGPAHGQQIRPQRHRQLYIDTAPRRIKVEESPSPTPPPSSHSSHSSRSSEGPPQLMPPGHRHHRRGSRPASVSPEGAPRLMPPGERLHRPASVSPYGPPSSGDGYRGPAPYPPTRPLGQSRSENLEFQQGSSRQLHPHPRGPPPPQHVDPRMLRGPPPQHVDPRMLRGPPPPHVDPRMLRGPPPPHVDPRMLQGPPPQHVDPRMLRGPPPQQVDPRMLRGRGSVNFGQGPPPSDQDDKGWYRDDDKRA